MQENIFEAFDTSLSFILSQRAHTIFTRYVTLNPLNVNVKYVDVIRKTQVPEAEIIYQSWTLKKKQKPVCGCV